jgi:glutaminyl-tRNA synthetase
LAARPGDAAHHQAGPLDPARIRTRFPPEPNGYLHVGHAKSICLNFGLAQAYGGACHLRFDDTNPEKEEQEYVDAIKEAVHWLGFDWVQNGTSHLYYASHYFDFMYRAAEALVRRPGLCGRADARADARQPRRLQHARHRQPLPQPQPGREPGAPARDERRPACPTAHAVLRAKIDMASPNINLRDPTLYRIKRATHHNTGDLWCIYPMYTYAHPIEDALENITHSICTLEFEDQRPFYDWLLENLADLGLLARPLPRQYEFGRLNLSYVITSKRKLRELVDRRRGHRLGRPAHAHHLRHAPARLHAGSHPRHGRRHRCQQDQHLARLRGAGRLPARRPGRPGAARDGRAGPGETAADNWAEVFGSAAHRTLPGPGPPAAP